jgi:hypothetical protein
MRKIIVISILSPDGVLQGPAISEETNHASFIMAEGV